MTDYNANRTAFDAQIDTIRAANAQRATSPADVLESMPPIDRAIQLAADTGSIADLRTQISATTVDLGRAQRELDDAADWLDEAKTRRDRLASSLASLTQALLILTGEEVGL